MSSHHRLNSVGGHGIMVVAMCLLPAGDVLTKFLALDLHPVEVAYWRFQFQAVVLILAVLALRKRVWPMNWPLVATSALLSAITLVSLVVAFTVMPVATAIAIFFLEPLILVLLSGLILGERTSLARYLAAAIGLLGALIIIRPNFLEFGWHAVAPLLAAIAYALNMIVQRKASTTMTPLSMQLGNSTIAAALLGLSWFFGQRMGIFRYFNPRSYELDQWMLLMALGVVAATVFLLINEAFKRAEAGSLAPLQYLEIIGATAFGYLIFGELPDAPTWFGAAVILSAGGYVVHQQTRQSRREAAKALQELASPSCPNQNS